MRRATSLLLLLLSSCGLHSPDISEPFDGPGTPEDAAHGITPFSATTQIEFEIRRKVYCELRDAVQHVNSYPLTAENESGSVKEAGVMIPNNWIAQVDLSLQVDESSALAPGVTYNDVMKN